MSSESLCPQLFVDNFSQPRHFNFFAMWFYARIFSTQQHIRGLRTIETSTFPDLAVGTMAPFIRPIHYTSRVYVYAARRAKKPGQNGLRARRRLCAKELRRRFRPLYGREREKRECFVLSQFRFCSKFVTLTCGQIMVYCTQKGKQTDVSCYIQENRLR